MWIGALSNEIVPSILSREITTQAWLLKVDFPTRKSPTHPEDHSDGFFIVHGEKENEVSH